MKHLLSPVRHIKISARRSALMTTMLIADSITSKIAVATKTRKIHSRLAF